MSLVQVREENKVAHVRMNRPDMRNAFNPDMIDELTKIFSGFAVRKDLRLVTFTGEGKIFSAGADLSWMKAMVNYSFEQNREDSLKLFAMFEAIALCPAPVLAVAHGAVMGGGLGLIACCDHVIAEEGTQFAFSEAKLGIAPAVISSFVLHKAALGVVSPLMISGRAFDAATALRAGLVHDVVPAGQGGAALTKTAEQWLEAGPQASREIKRLVHELTRPDWATQKERTTKLIAELRVSTEGQEGLKSFLEKRSPSWRDL